ncbi:hypothetical protein JD844_033509 [Phrynosoma platyrhinos]|uniref:Uncharacterized protein n=1 Tax=Phrynosoma platyrhinos TaxID=52577 RepID=A0ABQ7T6Y1_PHRPL|nr:hypothetical protein JD844_033509 [Phrynosoma platyrhinos]
METITEETEKPSKEKDQTEKENSKRENLSPRRLLSRQAVTPAKVTGVSLTEDLEKTLKAKASKVSLPEEPEKNLKSKVPIASPSEELSEVEPDQLQPTPVPEVSKTEQETSAAPVPVPRPQTPSPICQDHGRAGQEMCYLCLQRAQRSIPLQLSEERRKKEKEDDRILAQYQAMKDQEALQKQLMRDMTSREQKQKIAAFNLGVAEAIRSHKNQKSPDAYVKMKPAPLPEYVPDSAEAIFGKNDMNNEKMEERRKRAREYYKYQLQAAADHRRAAILSQLVDQRKAADMIERARKQWMAEKGARNEKIFQMNVALQEDWRKSAGMKRQRDYEEKLFQRAGDKLLLLEQCEKYRRCYRCKRSLNGCGEPSAWTDTKYIPGSRLVV